MSEFSQPPRSTSPNDPPQLLQERILKEGNQLSVLPVVAAQALRLAQDPECSIAEFAGLVERDLKLAADILSLANSSIYAPSSPIASLKQAVTHLGFRQCKNLIVTSSVTSLMQRITLEQQWIRDVLWRHCLSTAIHCHHLNRILRLGFQGEEFAAGLIHDFGRTLFAIAIPEQFAEIDPLDFDETKDVCGHERQIAGIDHAQFGAWFVQHSGLPDSFVDVTLCHHDSAQASALTALTIAGDHLANHLQRYLEPEQYQPEENPGIERLSQLGQPHILTRFKDSAVNILEESATDLVELTRRMK